MRSWTAKEVTMPSLTFPPVPEKAAVYFVDVPDAKQSVINIGTLSLTTDNPDFYKAEVANYMLGGGASAKLFMVLREEKGFTYGAYSYFMVQKSYGDIPCQCSCRSDATLESVQLFRDIMNRVQGRRSPRSMLIYERIAAEDQCTPV